MRPRSIGVSTMPGVAAPDAAAGLRRLARLIAPARSSALSCGNVGERARRTTRTPRAMRLAMRFAIRASWWLPRARRAIDDLGACARSRARSINVRLVIDRKPHADSVTSALRSGYLGGVARKRRGRGLRVLLRARLPRALRRRLPRRLLVRVGLVVLALLTTINGAVRVFGHGDPFWCSPLHLPDKAARARRARAPHLEPRRRRRRAGRVCWSRARRRATASRSGSRSRSRVGSRRCARTRSAAPVRWA